MQLVANKLYIFNISIIDGICAIINLNYNNYETIIIFIFNKFPHSWFEKFRSLYSKYYE